MKASLDSGLTSIQSLPLRTTGQDRLHSCLHFCLSGQQPTFPPPSEEFKRVGRTRGLHLSELTIAIRVSLSDMIATNASGSSERRGTDLELASGGRDCE
jgi:hypothetical protein